jgi:Domain of unknown function (DUF4276)
MRTLRFTLLAEGTSDRVLLPILSWMLLRHHRDFQWIGVSANLRDLPSPPRTLAEKITATCDLFPADVIFIHRDADRHQPSDRRQEIEEAIKSLSGSPVPRWVPVIPVRMTEAWLLVSEHAIRSAAGNPRGSHSLDLPPLGRLESIPDPKELLKNLLTDASGLTNRRKKKFNHAAARARIPDFLEDWNWLLRLPSAKRLDDEIGDLHFPSRDAG